MKRLVAIFTPKPDHAEGVRDVLVDVAANSRYEQGVLGYELNAIEGSAAFLTIEVYQDEAAFEAHLASDHVKRAVTELEGLLEGDIDVRMLQGISEKGSWPGQ